MIEFEEPDNYEHPSDQWRLQHMDAGADFCQHGNSFHHTRECLVFGFLGCDTYELCTRECEQIIFAGKQAKNSYRW